MDIREFLDPGAQTEWRVGMILAVYPGQMYVDVALGHVDRATGVLDNPSAPIMRQVTYMTGYGRAPRVGDTVHMIVRPDMGALILGTVTP